MSETVLDLDAYGKSFVVDPCPVYAELREQGPVHRIRTAELGEQWLVVGYEQARALLDDPRLSKDPRKAGLPEVGGAMARNMLTVDPPDHTRLRTLVEREFTPDRAEEMRAGVQRITDELLDELLVGGRAELLSAFALPLPATVLGDLLGVQVADRERFRAWTTRVTAPADEAEMVTAFTELGAYVAGLIEEKGRTPGGDLVSTLLRSPTQDGDPLTAEELAALVFLLILGGFEPTAQLVATTVRCLLTHPEQLGLLRSDPSLLDGAIEEAMRYEGPMETTTFRFALAPVEVGPVTIAAGDLVKISLLSANRDGKQFPDPDRFDIRRAQPAHLALGHGVHHCLGAPLARLTARIALRSLLERAPGLALDTDPADLDWIPGLLVRGVRALPVTF
jgi:cytochrome P450